MITKSKTKIPVITAAAILVLFFGTLFLPDAYPQSEQDQKYQELLQKYEALKADRDNVLTQTKRLLETKRSTAELEEGLEQLTADRNAFEEERTQILGQLESLNKETKELKDAKSEIEAERDQLRKAYEESQKATKIEDLRKEIAELKKENEKTAAALKKENQKAISELKKEYERQAAALKKENKKALSELKKERVRLNKDFKDSKDRIEGLTKLKDKAEGRIEELRRQVGEIREDYAEAINKNKRLEREIKDIPKKFSEIARQNKMLIKETSHMHYNLGVFYTKGQEYKRAIAEFAKAAEINPNDAYSHFNLGYIYAEYLVDRKKAIEHFRYYLRLAKEGDEDIDWVRKYLLTWETYEGKVTLK